MPECVNYRGQWQTKSVFIEVGKEDSFPTETPVCEHSTGPTTVVLLYTSDFKSSCALHLSQVRLQIVLFDDIRSLATTWEKVTYLSWAQSPSSRPVGFLLPKNNATNYQTTLHAHLRLQNCKIMKLDERHHVLDLGKITFRYTKNRS